MILSNFVQPSKAKEPIAVTELGIEIFVKLEQYAKAESLMKVTESGIVTLVTEEYRKAVWPIVSTVMPLILEGMTTTVSVPLYPVIIPVVGSKKNLLVAAATVTVKVAPVLVSQSQLVRSRRIIKLCVDSSASEPGSIFYVITTVNCIMQFSAGNCAKSP